MQLIEPLSRRQHTKILNLVARLAVDEAHALIGEDDFGADLVVCIKYVT